MRSHLFYPQIVPVSRDWYQILLVTIKHQQKYGTRGLKTKENEGLTRIFPRYLTLENNLGTICGCSGVDKRTFLENMARIT